MARKRHIKKYDKEKKLLEEANVPDIRQTIDRVGGVVEKNTVQVTIRTFPIMLGIPMDETMFSRFFIFYMRNIHPMPWDGFVATESTYLPAARNIVHDAFLDAEEYPFLMMIDSDVICPPRTIDILLSHELPVVAGWYRNKHPTKPDHPVVYDFLHENAKGKSVFTHRKEAGKGLEQVDGVGAGCILMSYEVASALGRSPYDMEKGGEDLRLCRKIMQLGYKMHVDWDINCAHLGVRHV